MGEIKGVGSSLEVCTWVGCGRRGVQSESSCLEKAVWLHGVGMSSGALRVLVGRDVMVVSEAEGAGCHRDK